MVDEVPAFFLSIISGGETGEAFKFQQLEVTLGRIADNDLVLYDGSVSRRHAILYYRNHQFIVEDLGSSNGTFLNQQQVVQPMVVSDGDVIAVGSVCFYFSTRDPAEVGEGTDISVSAIPETHINPNPAEPYHRPRLGGDASAPLPPPGETQTFSAQSFQRAAQGAAGSASSAAVIATALGVPPSSMQGSPYQGIGMPQAPHPFQGTQAPPHYTQAPQTGLIPVRPPSQQSSPLPSAQGFSSNSPQGSPPSQAASARPGGGLSIASPLAPSQTSGLHAAPSSPVTSGFYPSQSLPQASGMYPTAPQASGMYPTAPQASGMYPVAPASGMYPAALSPGSPSSPPRLSPPQASPSQAHPSASKERTADDASSSAQASALAGPQSRAALQKEQIHIRNISLLSLAFFLLSLFLFVFPATSPEIRQGQTSGPIPVLLQPATENEIHKRMFGYNQYNQLQRDTLYKAIFQFFHQNSRAVLSFRLISPDAVDIFLNDRLFRRLPATPLNQWQPSRVELPRKFLQFNGLNIVAFQRVSAAENQWGLTHVRLQQIPLPPPDEALARKAFEEASERMQRKDQASDNRFKAIQAFLRCKDLLAFENPPHTLYKESEYMISVLERELDVLFSEKIAEADRLPHPDQKQKVYQALLPFFPDPLDPKHQQIREREAGGR